MNGPPTSKLVIDSGSETSYISKLPARKNALLGPSSHAVVEVNRIQLGLIVLADSLLAVDTASKSSFATSPREPFVPADGGLSYKPFLDRLVTLDLPQHRLGVSTAAPLSPSPRYGD